jgi:hypothetical protein
MADAKTLGLPFSYRVIYMVFTAFNHRISFYVAWKLSEIVCIAGGLGFNGYNQDGSAKWDRLTHVHIFKFEVSSLLPAFAYLHHETHFRFKFATNLKTAISLWNIQTVEWLKYICFERMRKFQTLSVFLISTLWHGYDARYFFTYSIQLMGVYAGRSVSIPKSNLFLVF